MPKVGNTEFPYTKEGMAKAKAWSEMIGKPIKMKNLKGDRSKKPKYKPMPGRKTKGPTKAIPMPRRYQAGGMPNLMDPRYAEHFKQGEIRDLDKQEEAFEEHVENIANIAMGTVGGGGLGRTIFKTPKKAPSLISQANHLRKLLLKAITKTEKKAIQKKLAPIEKQIVRNEMEAGRKAVERGVEKQRRITPKYSEEHWDKPQSILKDRRRTSIKSLRQQGGDIPEYGFGGWLKKRITPSKKAKKAFKKISMKGLKKGWDKHIKHGVVTEGLRGMDKNLFGGRLSKAVTIPERYKRMSWKHMQKMKPMDFAAMGLGLSGPLALPFASMAANKAQKMYGTEGLRGDINKPAAKSEWIDPSLFGARKRFGSSQDISGILEQLMGGEMEEGGEVPAGRRMYGTAKKKKKSLQTADVGPVRGTYKKGGKIPKGWHV